MVYLAQVNSRHRAGRILFVVLYQVNYKEIRFYIYML